MKNRRNNKKHSHHQSETWICTICKKCLTNLTPMKDNNGGVYAYECRHCGEVYVPHEITYTER